MAQTNQDSFVGAAKDDDEDLQTFMRAKRKVATLHRAKRDEKRTGIK